MHTEGNEMSFKKKQEIINICNIFAYITCAFAVVLTKKYVTLMSKDYALTKAKVLFAMWLLTGPSPFLNVSLWSFFSPTR